MHQLSHKEYAAYQQKQKAKKKASEKKNNLKYNFNQFSLVSLEVESKNKDPETEIERFLAKLKDTYQKNLFHVYSVYTVFKREYEPEEIQNFIEILYDKGFIYQPKSNLYKVI